MNPVRFRAVLYVLMAALPTLIAFFSGFVEKVAKGEVPITHWAVWVLLGLNTFYTSVIALRAYYDGSAERSKLNDSK